jgi:prepilin-type N-terminal cleavage/methylation domain-containing protein
MRQSKVRSSKGFTLIELMIVVAIIGILAAVAIPKFADLVTKSKEASVKGNLGAIRSALSIYYGDTEGEYPNDVTTLALAGKYLPVGASGTPNLGNFTTPKTGTNPGHSFPSVTTTEVQQDDGSAASNDGVDAIRYIISGNRWGELFMACTHNDTKGTCWTVH